MECIFMSCHSCGREAVEKTGRRLGKLYPGLIDAMEVILSVCIIRRLPLAVLFPALVSPQHPPLFY